MMRLNLSRAQSHTVLSTTGCRTDQAVNHNPSPRGAVKYCIKLMKTNALGSPGLEVRRYMPVWYTGTSLVGLKSYRHFFLADCHIRMP